MNGFLGDRFKIFSKFLFLHDLELHRTTTIQVTVDEFINYFGEPDEMDFQILTQCLIKDYNYCMNDDDVKEVLNKWGIDWITYLLNYNVSVEEYELCSSMKNIMDGKI